MKFIVVCTLVIALASIAVGRKWEMCELARKMYENGFPEDQLDNWMCLVGNESGFEQRAVGTQNVDGSKDWGLYQISDIYWCQNTDRPGYGKNICQMDCQSFLDGDISQNLRCVKRVFDDMGKGFSAWMGWLKNCKGKVLPNTKPCFQKVVEDKALGWSEVKINSLQFFFKTRM